MDAQRPFLDNVELIGRIVRTVGRRHHLSRVEQEDFAGVVNIRLLENDCAVLRKFRARSTIWTYLVAVIERLLLDFIYERWGKWRPSTRAEALGPVAVLLERLVTRDGHALDEALEIIRINHDVGATDAELRAIWRQLPPRGRMTEVSEDAAAEAISEVPPEDRVEEAERRQNTEGLERALAKALAGLAVQDRLIIALRYDRGFSLEEIARLLQTSAATVRRRLELGLKHLRKVIADAGVVPAEVSRLIGHPSIIVSPLLRAELERFPGLVRLSKRDG